MRTRSGRRGLRRQNMLEQMSLQARLAEAQENDRAQAEERLFLQKSVQSLSFAAIDEYRKIFEKVRVLIESDLGQAHQGFVANQMRSHAKLSAVYCKVLEVIQKEKEA